jgi:hypothetical protein
MRVQGRPLFGLRRTASELGARPSNRNVDHSGLKREHAHRDQAFSDSRQLDFSDNVSPPNAPSVERPCRHDCAGARRGIPGSPEGAWLDRGPQYPDRLSLGWWRCRAHARLAGSCRWSLSSSCRRMGTTSRTRRSMRSAHRSSAARAMLAHLSTDQASGCGASRASHPN